MICCGVVVDLRDKALWGLVGIFVITIAVLAVLAFATTLGNYQTLESRYVRGEMNLIGNNIGGEVKDLESDVVDWGAWNDTYSYAEGKDPDYPASNIMNGTFRSLRVNFIIITDTDGRIISGRGYDLVSDAPVPLRPDLVAELRQDRARNLTTGRPGITSGFISLPEGPVILASYPILHNDYSGPSLGSVIMGRFVDDPEIDHLTAGTNLTLTIRPSSGAMVSPTEEAVLPGTTEQSVVIRPLDENIVQGQEQIRDVYGSNTLLLTLRMHRDIYQEGKQTIFIFTVLQMGVVLMAGLLILLSLDRMVLSRMSALSTEITGITRNWERSARIHASGNDEISRLAGATNRLLDRIEKEQAALAESEERYSAIVNNAPEPVLIIEDWIVRFVNGIGVSKSGYTRDELIGKNIRDFLTEESKNTVHEARLSRTATDGVSEYEVDFIRKDGRIIRLIVRAIDLSYHGEQSTLAILVDITERKTAEEALRQANRKLNLLSGVTRHDIKNQLLALSGFLELTAQHQGDPARTSEFIGRMKQITATLFRIINFTKDYEDLGVNVPGWQNVSSVVRRIIPLLPAENIRIDAGDPALEVFADPLLEKVFYNLIDNALRYGSGKLTAIRITHRIGNGNLVLTVEDDGTGIPPESKKYLFIRGYGKNMGLGLFLAREILSITDITITENGEFGNGARFEITVPKGGYRFTKEPPAP